MGVPYNWSNALSMNIILYFVVGFLYAIIEKVCFVEKGEWDKEMSVAATCLWPLFLVSRIVSGLIIALDKGIVFISNLFS